MRLDFTPLLATLAIAFVVVGSVQFLRDLPGGERGLLLFEKSCPIRGDSVAHDHKQASEETRVPMRIVAE